MNNMHKLIKYKHKSPSTSPMGSLPPTTRSKRLREKASRLISILQGLPEL